MYALPKSITINEQSFPIRENGDFRMVLDCFLVMEDLELSKEERILVCLILFYDNIDSIDDIFNKIPDVPKAVEEMFIFFNLGKPDNGLNPGDKKLIDWEKDSNLICSAINNVARTEIRSLEYLHWWTFMGYYMAIGECPLSHIVGIRNKIVSKKSLDKHEQEFRRENPEYFNWNWQSVESQEADKLIREIWDNS